MLAMLTFQHGHLQVLNGSPACLQFTPIMTVSYELVGITTSTVPTFPVNFSCLAVCLPWLAFLSPQFGCDLGLHHLGGYASNRLLGRSLHVGLDVLQDRFLFLIL
jgi:hypothetical protein